jgi:hypothetical protein
LGVMVVEKPGMPHISARTVRSALRADNKSPVRRI